MHTRSPLLGPAYVLALSITLLSLAPPATGAITVTGDVTPTYDGTDPWDETGTHFYIGETTDGSLTIDNGSEVYSGTASIGDGGNGTVTVTGVGSLWDTRYVHPIFHGSSCLSVGSGSTGVLNIENGAVVQSFGASISGTSGSEGTVTVTGPGSRWEISPDSIFSSHQGVSIGGQLNILDGGVVTDNNVESLMVSTSGSINISGAGSTLSTSFDTELKNTVIADGGKLVSVFNILLSGVASTTRVTGAGSSMDTPDLYVVESTLLIENAGYVKSDYATIGGTAEPSTVTVTGFDTAWESDNLDVYYGGVINIENGGRVFVGWGVFFPEPTNTALTEPGTINLTGGTLDLNDNYMICRADDVAFNFTGGTLLNAKAIRLEHPFVQNGGTLAPGGSIGQTDIEGDYDLNAGTLEIELGGVGDPIDLVTATADIDIASTDTTLDLRALGPMAAGTYTVLESTGGTITGMFENISPFNLFGVNVTVNNTGSAVTVTLDSDLIFADPNGDGFVELDDLDIVLSHWNQTVTAGDILSGDLDGDGFVGLDDLDAILTHWNEGTPPTEVLASVPEPATAVILFAGISALLKKRL